MVYQYDCEGRQNNNAYGQVSLPVTYPHLSMPTRSCEIAPPVLDGNKVTIDELSKSIAPIATVVEATFPAISPIDIRCLSNEGIPSFVKDNSVKSSLTSYYFQTISKWCKITDSAQHFSALYGHLLPKSKLFGEAALALSSKYLEIQGYQAFDMNKQLYHFAKDWQLDSVAQQHPKGPLLAFVVLCVFCTISIKPDHARSQLQESLKLVGISSWKYSSHGLPASLSGHLLVWVSPSC